MSSPKDAKPKLRPGDIGYVGRGVPPVHSRIKPNEVRNPWGSKGKPQAGEPADDFTAQMRELLAQPIRAKDGKTFTAPQVILNGVYTAVVGGDIRALKLLVELFEKYGVRASPIDLADEVGESRQALLNEALQRLEAKRASVDDQLGGTSSDRELVDLLAKKRSKSGGE